jgi:hypothetical protein
MSPREQRLPADDRNNQLAEFLALSPESGRCVLYLPQFRGDALLDAGRAEAFPLHYPGNTHSQRDARAAFYVTSLVSRILDPENISVENATTDSVLPDPGQTAFLFGSRSNVLTQRVAETTELRRLFRFDFGPFWKIEFGGEVFAVPDPSQLDEDSYQLQTDYGLIARSFDSRQAAFILAGLGDRATEGCGYFLARNWHSLFERFHGRDFALLLKFPPPADPRRFQLIAYAAI